ncbi:HTH-type transcriptional regulator DegA [Pontiella desulfatans]|uniref:HTH-type transcriptional regulator DegA n=1 Tax=Pontiella desulfatans TaxID=2750659 RepID=A0A6C2TY18_PONDE|nr:LacI family DNA-binding transcriptional regulator [Pontiella desulfatans]VGO12512.1 HTH-type transcriptional regulator DegA [Pontiella desulfatans]
MASLKDIANELNLSIPLVSKVLSGRMGTTGCSEENRLAILAKAKELGYKPNILARALRNGKTGSIGVFVHPLGAPGSDLVERLLMGLSTQANFREQRLCLSFYETDNEFLQRFGKTARAEIDGLLITGIYHPDLADLYKEIEESGIPIVTLYKNAEKQPGSINVYCDDFQVGYLPTKHLLENGCRKIAHIRSMEARYQGYLKALDEHGVLEDCALVFDAIERYDMDSGREAVLHWLENGIEFDGLVAESDHQAYGGINELLAHGKKVPDDVKVFGVDDSPVCSLCPIPISSVSQQVQEIGALAIDTLIKRIAGDPTESIEVAPELRLRSSTGN